MCYIELEYYQCRGSRAHPKCETKSYKGQLIVACSWQNEKRPDLCVNGGRPNPYIASHSRDRKVGDYLCSVCKPLRKRDRAEGYVYDDEPHRAAGRA